MVIIFINLYLIAVKLSVTNTCVYHYYFLSGSAPTLKERILIFIKIFFEVNKLKDLARDKDKYKEISTGVFLRVLFFKLDFIIRRNKC
jgi:hypothetical protein